MTSPYCDMPSESVKIECEKIKNNVGLSLNDKLKEIKLIDYSRVYDIVGASYGLHFNKDCYIFDSGLKYTTFWKSHCMDLPNIILIYSF